VKTNRFLAWLARLAQAIDRRLGEPITPRKPDPPRRVVVSIEAMAEPFTCTGCGFPKVAGWRLDGEPYCNLCARPTIRARWSRERSETPVPDRLAGDPR